MESGQRERASPVRLAFAHFVFDTRSGDLDNGAEPVHLSRQPAIVLRLLAERAGEVVTRAEIRDALWGTEVNVDFEQGINWCVRELRKVLGDDAVHPRFIQTIAKQGYRFLPTCSRLEQAQSQTIGRGLQAARAMAIAGSPALLIILVLVMFLPHRTAPTLLVLPLDNFTGDAHIDGLAEARTDYLIASLGVDPAQLRVIDRPTAYKFKNTGECIIHIGRQLHADYVLVGSIEPSTNGPRFSGGVFRVADNTQVWTRADIDPWNEDSMRELPRAIAAALR